MAGTGMQRMVCLDWWPLRQEQASSVVLNQPALMQMHYHEHGTCRLKLQYKGCSQLPGNLTALLLCPQAYARQGLPNGQRPSAWSLAGMHKKSTLHHARMCVQVSKACRRPIKRRCKRVCCCTARGFSCRSPLGHGLLCIPKTILQACAWTRGHACGHKNGESN